MRPPLPSNRSFGWTFTGFFIVLMRAFGRDAMCRGYAPGEASYWVNREPPGPADDSYRNMF